MKYSLIIPVYNRPDEVDELLGSLTQQNFTNYEVIVVEDGSDITCEHVVGKYTDRLDIKYFQKPNSGPGQTRNFGAERAEGEWLVILDSDVLVPEGYFAAIETFLADHSIDAFGGPDRAHQSFTDIQKAINYSMTSFFTTGGIRGKKQRLDKFYPRSFNMGIRREVYMALGGFGKMRFGEDVDFSLRIVEAGYKTALIEDAFVYHKRRTDLKKFWRQVYNSGIARINLQLLHPGSLKIVHTLPAVFTIGVVLLFLGGAVFPWLWSLIVLWALLIFVDSSIMNNNLKIGALSVAASFVQLTGYGCGFISAVWNRLILKRDEYSAYNKNFYK
ncbi:MAG: glycosyltransferase [Paludibacteraceae bacterium]|nr:glycosyltransferase [Paludibacteraceae bacterium]